MALLCGEARLRAREDVLTKQDEIGQASVPLVSLRAAAMGHAALQSVILFTCHLQ